jgi:hypothetical protein
LLGLFGWAAIFLYSACGPLASGQIRVGRSGGAPVLRRENPGQFWAAFSVSLCGLLFALAIALFVLRNAAPAVFAEAAHRLHLR